MKTYTKKVVIHYIKEQYMKFFEIRTLSVAIMLLSTIIAIPQNTSCHNEAENLFSTSTKKHNKYLKVTSDLDNVVTNTTNSTATYTVTVNIENCSDKKIDNITVVDQFLALYNVTINYIVAVWLVPSSPAQVQNDKIKQFVQGFYPTLDTYAEMSLQPAQSLVSPVSSLDPHTMATVQYTFTYFAMVDEPVIDLKSHITVSGTIKGKCDTQKAVCATSSVDLGPSVSAPEPVVRIGIVGGGLAGLTTAYQLAQAGLSPVVYEGSNRLGGRCFSGLFPNGQVFEHCGELIDSDQIDIINLVAQLGLTLNETGVTVAIPGHQATSQVMDYNYHPARKVVYTQKETADDYFNTFNPEPFFPGWGLESGLSIYEQIVNDALTYPSNATPYLTPWPLTYVNPAYAAFLDSMTLDEYINQLTAFLSPDGNGSKTKLAQFLKVAYVGEFGAEPDQQSPLNLIYLMGFQTLPDGVLPGNVPPELFQPYGISDQFYHVQGGNAQIVQRLVAELQKMQVSIYKETRLTKIKFDGEPEDNGPYQLTFAGPNGDMPSFTPPDYDHIVLAIPFATIRKEFAPDGFPLYHGQHIDISEANFSDLKNYAILNLSMSKNAKFNVQFLNRFWNKQGYSGASYATSNPYVNGQSGYEKQYQNSWDVTGGQPGKKGILVDYIGGNKTDQFRTSYIIHNVEKRNAYLKEQTDIFLKQLDFLFPGATSPKNFTFEFGHEKPYRYVGPYLTKSKDSEETIVNVFSDNPTENPWARGAYAWWKQGQYLANPNAFAGFEGVSEPYDPVTGIQNGTCHFAGEQTQYDNQGYLDGAVESGNRVACEILTELGFMCTFT